MPSIHGNIFTSEDGKQYFISGLKARLWPLMLTVFFGGALTGFMIMVYFSIHVVSGVENSIKLSEVCKGVK